MGRLKMSTNTNTEKRTWFDNKEDAKLLLISTYARRELQKFDREVEYEHSDNCIDIIFEDLNSRMCINCTFHDGLYCTHEVTKYIFGGHEVPLDFGCNKFEREVQ